MTGSSGSSRIGGSFRTQPKRRPILKIEIFAAANFWRCKSPAKSRRQRAAKARAKAAENRKVNAALAARKFLTRRNKNSASRMRAQRRNALSCQTSVPEKQKKRLPNPGALNYIHIDDLKNFSTRPQTRPNWTSTGPQTRLSPARAPAPPGGQAYTPRRRFPMRAQNRPVPEQQRRRL